MEFFDLSVEILFKMVYYLNTRALLNSEISHESRMNFQFSFKEKCRKQKNFLHFKRPLICVFKYGERVQNVSSFL
jgi:hypothetical protein